MTSSAYRALICITTCRRFENLLRYLPHYAAFCRDDSRFQLLVALDGTEDPYLRFCEEWQIPLVYSDRREGVGLSKNRVLERYPEYDYYFFIEDDVELMDGRAFPIHAELYEASGIHHFSLFERGGVRGVRDASEIAGHRVVHGQYGGAQFNFFTRQGLERVGGWHPDSPSTSVGGTRSTAIDSPWRTLLPPRSTWRRIFPIASSGTYRRL